MKFSTLSAWSAIAGLTLGAPVDMVKRQRQSRFSEVDITILQFALTLEHLENTFYQQAFNTFQLEDFLNAGFTEEFFINLQFIAFDESTHVSLLQSAIASAGVAPVLPCTYNFPVTDVASFVTLSAVLESIGTSAYLGAAGFVESKDILTIAASIMATEGLHTSLQRSSLGAIGAADPFTTPLDANSVFTLAAQFITSCPESNQALPFTAFPGLTVDAQQCFNEVGSFGVDQVQQAVSATETTTADYATITWADSTDTAVGDIAAASTTVDAAAEAVTDTASAAEAAAVTEAAVTDAAAAEAAVATEAAATETAVATEAVANETAAAETAAETAAAETAAAQTTAPAKLRFRRQADNSSEAAANATVEEAAAATEAAVEEAAATATEAAEAVATEAVANETATATEAVGAVATEAAAAAACSPISAGSTLNLTPDFSSSRHDLSRVTQIFVTFVEGLNVISIGVGFNGGIIGAGGAGGLGVQIPSGISGQVFVFITIIDVSGGRIGASDVLFGPAIVEVAPSLPQLGL